ncbi:MAG TPA: V-type ATP synthase subunit K [Candidatus Omnitrophota bacterium]|nr:V-type ATP synthase subunit K [Candidatus Omnitrophota bacterium]HNQ49927.1 V-type ATP synthase subunit K [Candidatus Omnitrophota bacterium]HQO37319.1 V-type ATP synthase subunit K [Candidatus Omnitrophota bacterium]HQQ05764.1 V-type ATP synthase subunit K [Candidatus Omnitrophota bacterium]
MQFRDLGLGMVLALAAFGSAAGAGIAGMAAIGAWKKNFVQNKAASFMLVAFVGAPLTQTIYGMIVMNRMAELALQGQYLWGIGAFAGAAMGLSAYWQGKCAAVACDAMGETNKGFGNYIVVLGMAETVALFVMAFTLGVINKLAGA